MTILSDVKALGQQIWLDNLSRSLVQSGELAQMLKQGVCGVTSNPAIFQKSFSGDALYADETAALKRHLEFYNTHPWVSSVVFGVTAAMEEQKAKGEEISEETITSVKVGLMGPLAGVGDPIFWGTARPVLAALGASLALNGSIVGPLLFFFGLTAIRWATRWYGFKYGYEKGTQIVTEAGGNTLQKITQGASVMGLFVMGALVYRWTSVNIPLPLTSYKNQAGAMVDVTVQSVLNDLLPGLASLGLCFLCMWLLKKKVNAIWLIFALFAVGILGSYLGFLAL